MAHGYAQSEGKPIAVMAHGTVGLQHAAMAIYNAYCDRVPVYMIVGNIVDANKRIPPVEWAQSVQDAAAMVRDYVKWDDLPMSLPHFAESAVRAYKIAMTPPMMPVALVADGELQENPDSWDAAFHVPQQTHISLASSRRLRSGGRGGAPAGCSRESRAHQRSRRAHASAGMASLMELAETLQAPVIDQAGRMNFPTRHLF